MLVEYVRDESIRDRLARGEAADYVEAAARAFAPNVLTIGFARRVATYKRLYLLTREGEHSLFRLLADDQPQVQVIIAGKAHPADQVAKDALRDTFRHKDMPAVARRVVFLEDYDLSVAPLLVAGVDLWLNLPRPPLEASGTSGMKVVLNGGLNLSVLDGWWSEAYDGSNGWAIESVDADPHIQDEHDAAKLATLLEREAIPLFYDRDAEGIPHGWIRRVKASMRSLIPRFSAERMVREYVTRLYPFSGKP
jgi:starch phosphorylase